MAASFLRLAPADQLAALGQLDGSGRWNSLDDQRLCRSCGRVFAGHEIAFSGGIHDLEPLEAHCPTLDCAATSKAWIFVGKHVRRRSAFRWLAAHEAAGIHDHVGTFSGTMSALQLFWRSWRGRRAARLS